MACSREFRAAHDSGIRPLSEVKWIVLHDEEATTARSAAAWFNNPDSAGSAHVAVDDKECYRCLPDARIPWAAANANEIGLHLEMAGFAAWKKWQWLKHRDELNAAAKIVARWCDRYDIPPHFISVDEMIQGKRGITTHARVSAFTRRLRLRGDSSHTDPGLFFPKRRFARKVRRELAELRCRKP
jgi:N-acetyl-anhydromuramyl-L-alanine amidase AmpD